MKIGIDLDDVVFATIRSMIKYADKYDAEEFGKTIDNDKFGLITNRYYLNVLYDWDDEVKFAFFHKYYKNVLEECELLPNAKEVINKLYNEGNEINFITARLMNIDNCDTENITRNSLDKNGIKYNNLYVGVKNKLDFCKSINIDLLIEDSYETCKEFRQNGIKSLLMTTKMNENIVDNNIVRVNNWLEIMQKIEEFLK